MRLGLVGLMSLAACAMTPTSTSSIPDWILDEWAIGQERVILAVGGSEDLIYATRPEMFYFEEMDGTFKCGGVEANGCYSSRRHRIRYNKLTPTVVRHEAGHAILHRMQLNCWHNFEHTEFPYGCRR